MKIGGKQYRSFIILALVVSSISASPFVHAADSQVRVIVGDVCPNIDGNQPELPEGMQFDDNGDCYTPAPPPPPAPRDACPNLSGDQAAIPNGYYRNQADNCIVQTKPPKDVCPNINDTQANVPYGMQTADSGDCVWPPADACSNIDGPQATMPEGMSYNSSNECYTPDQSSSPTDNPPSKPDEGVSAIMNPLPYYIIAAYGFITLLLLVQTVRESFVTQGVIALFKRKKHELETLEQLMARIMSQLHDDIHEIIDAMPGIAQSGQLSAEEVTKTSGATTKLQSSLSAIIVQEAGLTLEDPGAFSLKGVHVKTMQSLLFLLPTIITIAAVIITNVLLGVSAPIMFDAPLHWWLQAAAILILSGALYLVLRTRHARHIQHQHLEKLVEVATNLTTNRESALQQIHIVLDMWLSEIKQYRKPLLEQTAARSYTRLFAINEKLAAFYLNKNATDASSRHETLQKIVS